MADTDKLALGLDDIIKIDGTNNRRGGGGARRGFRSRGGGRGGGNFQGTSNGFRTRGGGGIPRSATAPAGRWKHDLYEDNGNRNRPVQRTTTGVNTSAKLLVSNLDYGVTKNDIQELFEDIGAVRVARVHYDESGRSLGTAEVVYERRVDAVNAQQKYNGLNLDGRPMDIKLVGGNEDQSNSRNTFNGGNQRAGGGGGGGFRNNNQQQNNNRGGANRSRGGGGGRGRGQQNGFNGNTKKENLTAEDLDAELDAYLAEGAPKK